MRLILLLCFGISGYFSAAQSSIPGSAQIRHTFLPNGTDLLKSPVLRIPLHETAHFVAFTLRCEDVSSRVTFELRTADSLYHWSDWQQLEDDQHTDPHPGRRQFEQVFLPAETRRIQIRAGGLNQSVDATLFFFSPVGAPERDPEPRQQPASDRSACPCPQPAYVDRAAWGGPPTQQPGCTPHYTTVTHLIVHHQAGVANPPYSAVVQAIWQQHVFTNGWCDIGYNWLIAPDGTVFEGRAGGNNVVGAHFSGMNSNTMGVCFLGNFQTDQPTEAALHSLEQLLAWKCCDSDIEPIGISLHAGSGLMLNHISGHRDGGSTLCPGDNLYARLPAIRLATDSLYHDPNGCDGLWPPANDACPDAMLLISTPSCQAVSASTDNATASGVPVPACSGFTSGSALDVWFRFIAVEAKHRVTVSPLGQGNAALDPVVAVYGAVCANPQLIACVDAPGGAGGQTILDLAGLIPGQEYHIRVFDFGTVQASDGRFDICVTHGVSAAAGEKSPAGDWHIFPNPATNSVTVQLPETGPDTGIFRLYDLSGRLLAEYVLGQRITQIDLSGRPAGLFVAEIRTSGGMGRQRLLKLN